MIVYRVAHPEFSSNSLALNGLGAFSYGGRWNQSGSPIVYCSDSIEAAIAEKGYYSIKQKVDQILKKKNNISQFLYSEVKDQEYYLLEIELSNELKFYSANSDTEFQKWCTEANTKTYTRHDARKSPYQLLPEKWTQKVGELIKRQAAQAVTYPSARSKSGNVICFFPRKIFDSGQVKVMRKQKILLSAATYKKNKIRESLQPLDNFVFVEFEDRTTDCYEILNYPHGPF